MNFLPAQFEPKCGDEDSPHLVLPHLIILLRSLRLLRLYISRCHFKNLPQNLRGFTISMVGSILGLRPTALQSENLTSWRNSVRFVTKCHSEHRARPPILGQTLWFWNVHYPCAEIFWYLCQSLDVWTFVDFHGKQPLNRPFITKILSLKACGWLLKMQHHHPYFPSVPLGDRLFLRVRRRLRTLGSVPTIHSFQAQAWNTLFCLTSPGRLSFDTGRRLRTGEFHDWGIYALHRLANHLEQPKRGQARKLLASAMQFRNLTESIQFPASDSFSKAIEKFLREHVIQFKELAVPLDLPTAKIREAASPKLSAVLQNFKAFDHLDHGHDGSHLSCCCPQLLDKVSPHIRRDVQRQFGLHVAFFLEDLILPPDLRLLQYANANSTFSLTKKDFFTRFHAQVRSWSKYHGLPPIGDDFIEEFLETHWVLHTAQLNMLLGTPNSWWYASRPGCPDLALFIMLIMRLTNSLFFALVFISKEHTEPGVTKIYLNLLPARYKMLCRRFLLRCLQGCSPSTDGELERMRNYQLGSSSWSGRNSFSRVVL